MAVGPIRWAPSAGTLERIGGIAALLTVAVLLLGLLGLAIQQQGLGLRNWLVVLFQMNAGIGSLPSNPLRVLNPLDVAVLALVGLTFLGCWPAHWRQHKVWTGIAVALPFIGIPLLLVTGLQGRSAVMGAGLVLAVLMLLGGGHGRLLALLGLVANALLLGGDLGTGVLPGGPVAAAVGVGYVLLIGWFTVLAASALGAVRSVEWASARNWPSGQA